MKILHTSDWHVGKVLKGVARIDEQRAVLGEITSVARERRVDLVVIAGDLFESAVPTPDAQALVWSTLLAFHDDGAHVVVIAGNHDNGLQFEALRSLAGAAGITVVGRSRRPQDGGAVDITTADGQRAHVALFPFLSQRAVVRAAELMNQDAAQNAGSYAERCRLLVDRLCAGFATDTVNLVVAHGMVRGGRLGGGERDAQVIEDYWIDPTVFPPSAHYVALGHLHRSQQLPGSAPIWYSGSPVQVDFGEGGDAKYVLLVEADPATPAVVTQIPLAAARRLRTVEGTLEQLRALATDAGDDLLRVFVRSPGRAGLAEEVRQLFPNAIDVRLVAIDDAPADGRQPVERRDLTPHQLFAAFLAEQDVADPRVERLFARLLDEATGAP